MSDFKRNIIITGGAGFIGSHVVRLFVNKYPDYRIINVDKLTYAGNLANLKDIEDKPNYVFVKADICDFDRMLALVKEYNVDGIIHLAAESHVDRSIKDPFTFAKTNVMGTLSLLQAAKVYWDTLPEKYEGKRFYHISTDEVYGALEMTHPEGVPAPFTTKASRAPQPPKGGVRASADPAYYEELKKRAQYNRNHPTEAESLMWNILSSKKIDGFKFRRQHIIGQYIADFVCLEKMLVIEVDGGYHYEAEQKENDAERTKYLSSLGYRVIRFTNEEVTSDWENVIDRITSALQLPLQGVGGLAYGEEFFVETTKYNPHSPYSASKASSDHFVRAYHDTYGLPTIVTNCSNNYGPYQFPEKLIPLFINNIRHRKPLPVYGKGENVRDWLFVEDHARAIDVIFHNGKIAETYNIGGFNEWKNIDIIKVVINTVDRLLGRKEGEDLDLITYVTDRLGHDMRYAIDSRKLQRELGWEPSLQFEEGIEKTVRWYLDNEAWVDNITSGDYQSYYDDMYGNR